MGSLPTVTLGLSSLLLVIIFYLASADVPKTLSPQGCRMSWMNPDYILQSQFNTSWSPLADRYSLWLYREYGRDFAVGNSVPVLFIPGNSGSSHQVRSIASSANRQFYSEPYVIDREFNGRGLKALDFYAVEFNEDLSAFHGPTLESERTYSSSAISYILSLYPPNTQIIVMGHSMGGVVATSLLPSPNISAIITMSTPHTLPPARFDSRIDKIYARNYELLLSDTTPILSLCGGATDMMIPSESCILPEAPRKHSELIYRRTVFTSALEGSWTGVGHREMVWCHQVRWRVARAAIELGGASSIFDQAAVFDRWLRDGNHLVVPVPPLDELSLSDPLAFETLPDGMDLVLRGPKGSRTYLLPVGSSSQFVLYLSQGSILSVSPQHSGSLRASVYLCHGKEGRYSSGSAGIGPTDMSCRTLPPSSLKLIPNPVPGKPFPLPEEGADESEGVVVFEASIVVPREAWVAVQIEGGDGSGWVIGGLNAQPSSRLVVNNGGTLGTIFGTVSVDFPTSDRNIILQTDIQLPNLLLNALIVYRLKPMLASAESQSLCEDALLPPLLVQTSYPSESHYYPLTHSSPHPPLLHAHSSAPYIPDVYPVQSHGLNLTLYSSASSKCLTGITVQIDWWSTFGRWGSRYMITTLSWAVGVISLIMSEIWRPGASSNTPTVPQSLRTFISRWFVKALVLSLALALLPLPASYYLGNKGEPLLAVIAPLLLIIALGLVCASWWLLLAIMWPISRFSSTVDRSLPGQRTSGTTSNSTLISMCLIFILIFLFIPWQVAFLGCWAIHLYTCASAASSRPSIVEDAPIPLISQHSGDEPDRPEDVRIVTRPITLPLSDENQNMHILLLMTWLLPLVAPFLVVRVRTLITAGFIVSFDGDHNFMNVAPFLLLLDLMSSGRISGGLKSEKMCMVVRWCFLVLAVIAFFIGARATYRVFDGANLVVATIVVLTYWETIRSTTVPSSH